MFTTIDKAIAAVLGGLISYAALKWGFNADWVTPEVLAVISSAVSGLLAYVVPNKAPKP